MSQPIQRPDVSQRLQELFRLVGRVRPSLEEYVIPTVQVADLGVAAAPPVRRVVQIGGLRAAVAGEHGIVRIGNPAGSNNIIQLKWWDTKPAAASTMYMAFVEGTLASSAAIATLQYTDRRADDLYPDVTADMVSGTVTPANLVAIAAGSFANFNQSNQGYTNEYPAENVVLAPGDFVIWANATANTSYNYNMVWEEFSLL